jgi:soluble cytochrome b562
LDLIGKDWWETATVLATKAIAEEKEINNDVKKKAQDKKRSIDKLIQTLDSKAKVSRVIPAYQWAQSPDRVFIDVKFAHRLDSPGCLEVTSESITLEEDRLKFSGLCTQSSHRIKFDLDIELHDKIVPDSSSHVKSSVGRLTFTLVKAATAAWPQPSKGKKPTNVHVWWEMKERYQKEMNKLTGEVDEEDSGLKGFVGNPDFVIKDSVIKGERIDNSRDREL